MKKRMLILTPIALGLLCMMIIGLACAKATVIYDLNNDGVVDVKDLACVAAAFGSRLGDPRWNPATDLDENGKVDIIDILLVARQFGLTLDTSPIKTPPAKGPPAHAHTHHLNHAGAFDTPPVRTPS